MVTRAKHLYRKEYFDAQKSNNEGVILLKTSFNQNIYLLLSLIVLAFVFCFLFFGEYTRKESIVGVVSPMGGIVKVQANDFGFVEKIFVKEGDQVESMASLYKIKTDRFDDTGFSMRNKVINSIDKQIELLIERKEQESDKYTLYNKKLLDSIVRIKSEEVILKSIIDISLNELELTEFLFNKQKKLFDKDFISENDYNKSKLGLFSKKSELKINNLNLQKLIREREKLNNELLNNDISLKINLKEIDKQLEVINQNKAELLYQSDSQVISPINGIVASILAEEGHSVTKGQPLIVIVPKSNKSYVELYASSRNVGFVKVGQKVNLRFDAFPHEKFGVQTGTVKSVSLSAVDPAILANKSLFNSSSTDGLYQIEVELNKPTITVYGKEEHYVPGMTVVADVELDTRNVYEWILEPLYTIKGKM
ncbi:HlyD family secretion protein [Photobacterium leiognathi]|uniref:HlyD family secretion protein n=1 Tax=Photobacterium leiognathi TaxID=553611 RepID=UPI002980F30C|nr:HlyD family efflux transporter periplasmic adaptor subunit [Photobacterium leiognathi]